MTHFVLDIPATGSASWEERSLASQHHPAWSHVLDELGESVHTLQCASAENTAAWLTFTVRRSPWGTVVSSSPYLPYGGPVFADQATERQLLDELMQAARRLQADIVSVATHPLQDEATVDRWAACLDAPFRYRNLVQIQDTTQHPLTRLSARSRNDMQRKIRKAERQGVAVRRATSLEDVGAWLSIYRERFREIGATPYPDDFFLSAFRHAVPLRLAELWLTTLREQIIGGVWILAAARCADYFASAFDSDFKELFPITFAMNRIFESLAQRGVPVLNWQASPGQSGVHEYKRRWGAETGRHYYLWKCLNDRAPLLQGSPKELKTAYPARFVVPYELLSREAAGTLHAT